MNDLPYRELRLRRLLAVMLCVLLVPPENTIREARQGGEEHGRGNS